MALHRLVSDAARYRTRVSRTSSLVSARTHELTVCGSASGISCDACGDYPMTPTRFLCLDCSQEEVDQTIDLCIDCFTANKHATRDEKVHHPAHNMIQFRTVNWRIYRHPTFVAARMALSYAEGQLQLSKARSAVQTTTEGPDPFGLACGVCKSSISAPPYWCCLTCDGMPRFRSALAYRREADGSLMQRGRSYAMRATSVRSARRSGYFSDDRTRRKARVATTGRIHSSLHRVQR